MIILSLKRGVFNEETGWQFEIDFEDGNKTALYRTNAQYNGLWCWSNVQQNWHQCKGTSQFCLSKLDGAAKQQIKKQMQFL